ncbi:PAS domain-containing protein [Deferrisoma sp.]
MDAEYLRFLQGVAWGLVALGTALAVERPRGERGLAWWLGAFGVTAALAAWAPLLPGGPGTVAGRWLGAAAWIPWGGTLLGLGAGGWRAARAFLGTPGWAMVAAWGAVEAWGALGLPAEAAEALLAWGAAGANWWRGRALSARRGGTRVADVAAVTMVLILAAGWAGTAALGRREWSAHMRETARLAKAWVAALDQVATSLGEPPAEAGEGGRWVVTDGAVCRDSPAGRRCTPLPPGDYELPEEPPAGPEVAAARWDRVGRWVVVRADLSGVRTARLAGMAFTLSAVALVALGFTFEELRRRARWQQHRADLRLRRILDAAPDAVFLVDEASRRVLWANRAAQLWCGRPAGTAAGVPLEEVLGDVAGAAFDAPPVPAGEGAFRITLTGRTTWVQATAAPAEFGETRCRLVVLRDVGPIVERSRREAELGALLSTVLDHAENGILVLAPDHRIRYHNRRYRELWGIPEDVLWSEPTLEAMVRWACNRGIYDPSQEDDLARLRADHLEAARREGRKTLLTPRRDGREVEAYAVALPDGGFLVSYQDVTERRRAERALREAKDFGERLVASLAVAAFVQDPGGRVIAWNRAAERLTGVPADAVIGTAEAWRGFYPAPRPTLADLVREGREIEAGRWYPRWGPSPLAPQGLRAEGWYENLNGKRRFIVFDAAPVRDAEGRLLAVVETIQDLTDLEEAEGARRMLETAVDQAAEGLAVLGPGGRMLYGNRAFRNLFPGGLPEGLWAGHREDEVWRARLDVPGTDGDRRRVAVAVSPVRAVSGEVSHRVAVALDVTREEELERHLRQAQKLEALGTLAGGIAHDFNNILVAVVGYAELGLDLAGDGRLRGYLERILSASERARELVRRMLAFSREPEGDPRPIRLGEAVEEAVELLRPGLTPRVDLRYRREVEDDRVEADPVQVQQVVMNLVTNAGHALPEGEGRIEVAIRDAEVDDDLAARWPGVRPGRFLRLTVSDTGCGIPPEVLPRIFDPFFTTKEVGQGTGLGLASVYGIVKAWGGFVDVRSEVGRGTTFHVFVPALRAASAAGGPVTRGRGELVLLVDDEEGVREVLADILRAAGYRVLAHSSGREALAAFYRDPAGIAAVLTDQAMPGIDGVEVLRQMRKVRPELPAVLCTGYDREEARAAATELGVRVLLKPFTARAVLEALTEALAGRRDEGRAEAAMEA